jgi:hypothetical protein
LLGIQIIFLIKNIYLASSLRKIFTTLRENSFLLSAFYFLLGCYLALVEHGAGDGEEFWFFFLSLLHE